jgi:AraC-like DNA-binding protein
MGVVTVDRHESAAGGQTLTTWTPRAHAPQAAAIKHIWYFDGVLTGSRDRILPDGTLELIVQLDTPHCPGIDGPADPFPPLCVTGLRTTAEVIDAPVGRCRVLGVTLKPTAAFALLGQTVTGLTALTVDLHAVIGRAAAELGASVHDAPDATAAVQAAAAWAERRIARGLEPDATVERALTAIRADGGVSSIAALEAWHGRSRTRFNAAFRDRVGVSPKRFARIVRFDRARHALDAGRASLGEIALAAGYYDQAHFTSEFQEHAGLAPSAYLRRNFSKT